MTSEPSSPQPDSARLGYLPALDGLRAVAVAMVVAYHLDAPWARGGFLGVDLFFVISGFLITTLLLRERRATGRIAVGGFWVRRFKRLVPPVVVMVLATVLATRAWGVPEQWNGVRADAVSALGYVANWRFVVADQSYFTATLGPSPLRHTWSLALEEQWYLVWPVVVAALCWLSARTTRRWLPTVVVLGAAAGSAVLMTVLYDAADPSRVYYGTDTRAQQLLIGAALAFVAHRRPGVLTSKAARNPWLMHSMLLVFVLAAVVVDDRSAWLYHGGLVALSLVGAVIVAGVAVPDRRAAIAWLGAAPLLWLGRRSYAVYLWHWPVIVFVGQPMGIDLPAVPLAALQVAVTLLLSILSYRFVETPVRRSRRAPAPVIGGWSLGAVGCVVVALTALAVPHDRNPPIAEVVRPTPASVVQSSVPDPVSPTTTEAIGSTTTLGSTTTTSITPPSTTTAAGPADVEPKKRADLASVRGELGSGQAAAATPPVRRLLLVGDSTALVMSTRQPMSSRWTTDVFARLGCSTTDGATVDEGSNRPTPHAAECADWRDEWNLSRDIVVPDVAVVMIGAWEVLDHVVDGETVRFPSDEWTAVVRDAVEDAAAAASGGGNEVVFTSLPCMQQSSRSGYSVQARNDIARVDAFNAIIEAVAADRELTSVVSLDDLLCPGGAPLNGADGENIRYDGVHLTPEGVDLTWTWLLDELDAMQASPTT